MLVMAQYQDKMQQVGQRIRELIARQGLHQSEVARRAGMNPQQLNELLRGRGNPTFRTFLRIAEVLGCRVTDFLQDDEGVAFLRERIMSSLEAHIRYAKAEEAHHRAEEARARIEQKIGSLKEEYDELHKEFQEWFACLLR